FESRAGAKKPKKMTKTINQFEATQQSDCEAFDLGLPRRRFLGISGAALVAGWLGVQGSNRRIDAMTSTTTQATQQTASENADIRPFKVSFPDSDLADLKSRIKATRWPEKETVDDETQGVQLATMQALAKYWVNDHVWRKCEARL